MPGPAVAAGGVSHEQPLWHLAGYLHLPAHPHSLAARDSRKPNTTTLCLRRPAPPTHVLFLRRSTNSGGTTAMVSTKSVTFFGVITAATLAGIYIVHRQQQTEREVRLWRAAGRQLGKLDASDAP